MDAEPIDRLALRGAPDAPALIDRAGVLSYADLDLAVSRLAALLRAYGLAPGDRVASWLAKTRIACLMPLAAARAGLIHVPVNPLLKRAQVAHILADSGARLLVTNAGRAASLEAGDLGACILLDETEIGLERGAGIPPSDGDSDAVAAILYTSGSTGRPKGVVLSHRNLWLGAAAVVQYLGLSAEDRVLCVLPLSFDYGQNQLFSSWYAGGAVVPFDYLFPKDVAKAVAHHDITVLAGVPPLWGQLAAIDWPETRLRTLTNSGGRLPVPLVRTLRALFPQAALHSMYGLTEAFRSSSLDPALIDAHPDAVGAAIPFAELLVVRSDGRPADPGEPGELVHCGPLVAQGYWNDPARTAERFRPAPAASRLGGTAVWSGDTMVVGADGLLRFVAREDEMIKTAGNRVSPTEIEEAVIASGLAVEAVAWGVADDALGQVILLAVSGDAARDGALRAYLRHELPNFMQPRDIFWAESLPRNPNGKLDRAGIAKDFTS